jgi:hypothetical protein
VEARGLTRSFSILCSAFMDTPDSDARSARDQPSKVRAARIWAGLGINVGSRQES